MAGIKAIGRRHSAVGRTAHVRAGQTGATMAGAAREPKGRRIGVIAGRVLLAGAVVVLAGCSGGPKLPKLTDLNPFKKKERLLPGKRISILARNEGAPGELETAAIPMSLPAPKTNVSWAQPGGEPNNAPGHLALGSSLRVAFRANAGAGSSKYGRLIASPIVYDGRVYTLDAQGNVTAFSSGGKRIWRKSTRPATEAAKEGFGGGLAADNGRLYVATGYGIVYAFDPRSGKQIWLKKVGVPVRSSPTAVADKVFMVGTDGRFFCLSGVDGSQVWGFRGLPQTSRIVTNVSPAVSGDTVVVPYPSGELVALRMADGQAVWTESLARARRVSSLASMSDPGRPVIDGGVLYAVGHAGRMIATKVATGERLWAINLPGIQTPWVAGDAVFVVDTSGKLAAISKKTGKIRWQVGLPGGRQWAGPVLAGGKLWLVSKNGKLVSVEATNGKVASKQNLGAKVYIAPIVANGRMYILADNGKLIGLQ